MNIKFIAFILHAIVVIPVFSQEVAYIIGEKKLICKIGDITKQNTQCIVNAANTHLEGGSGVCGAIFKAAGASDLQKACYEHNGCPIGDARITSGFKLQEQGITCIIHAVGPDCRIAEQKNNKEVLLTNAYRNSFILANENNISSISFPFISSAIYAYPKKEAAKVALDEIIEQVKKTHSLKEVRMVLFSEEDYDIFLDQLDSLGFTSEKSSAKKIKDSHEDASGSSALKVIGTMGITALIATLAYKYFKKSEK